MLVTQQHLNALTLVWLGTGSRRLTLPKDTQLWHCGHIRNRAAIDDGKMLWTTCSPVKGSLYRPTALNGAPHVNMPAMKLDLVTLNDLSAADFDKASLVAFTYNLCEAQHDGMKDALRAWCIAKEFDSVVSINGDADEVAIVKPKSNVDVVSALRL